MKKTVWAIVTGASSGIGFEFAHILASHGVNLIVAARNVNALNSLATDLTDKYQTKTYVFAGDLSQQSIVLEFVEFVNKHKVVPDYLINNAGFGDFGYFVNTHWSKEEKMLDLNIKTLTYLTKIYAQAMVKRGHGKIVNVSSGAAFQPGPLMAIYFATKAYVLHFSEAISQELEGTRVSVTALCPGPTESNFWRAAGKEKALNTGFGKMPTSHAVAQYGYYAMLSGKHVAIYGIINRLGAFLVRFVPRSLVVKVLFRAQVSEL